MKKEQGVGFLHYGIAVTTILSAILGYNLFRGDQGLFLPGETTHGHHQIEMQCSACHVESFETGELTQQACVACHGEALEKARDTHPKKKFTDPRNADLLANLDATQCVTCHIEHSPEITGEFGVTLPEDFCFYCHRKIGEERPSHADYEFTTCSDAGCHNYHDNKALYEQFLAKHLDEPDVLKKAVLRTPNAVAIWQKKNRDQQPLAMYDQDGQAIPDTTQEIVMQWSKSVHAEVQVNCSSCHDADNWPQSEPDSAAHSDIALSSCASCHERQYQSFKEGLHGMRLNADLPPMMVKNSRLPMHKDAAHKTLNCSSCHDPHQPDLQAAAVESCLGCHDDEHSRNYKNTAHFDLWQKEVAGNAEEGTGVSCASCHMPRTKKGKLVYVDHNQSQTLEPNSKMLRPVCLNCHGLEFSIAALTDRALIEANFQYAPVNEHPSFKLVRQRIEEKKAARRNRQTKN